MQIHTLRAGEGVGADMARQVFERYRAGEDFGDALKEGLVQAAIDKYQPKIAAAMRRAGLDVADDQELTQETITDAIREKTGLDLEDLTRESIAAALDGAIARELSAQLGVEVSSVLDLENLKSEVIAAAVESVKSGRANALMTSRIIGRVRVAATWARAGVAPAEQARIMGAWYQKKYRRTHRQVWD